MTLMPFGWLRRGARDLAEQNTTAATARRERIARRMAMDETARDPAILLTTHSHPIYYLSITKCGCTFLKNLLYALDHGQEHPDGVNIHETEDGLIHAIGQDYATVYDSPYAFTVLRDPAARFMSFYFDKIWGEGTVNFPLIRARLEAEGVVDLARDLDAEAHRANAYRLLDWVSRNLNGETDLAINYHWRPQTSRLRRARMFRLNHLTLEGLDWQLPLLMAPLIPDMAARMAEVKARNRSARPATAEGVLDADLATAIRRLYRADTILHDRAARRWAIHAPGGSGSAEASPPMPRHHRARRLALPGRVALTGAPGDVLDGLHGVLAAHGLARGEEDILLDGLAERGDRVLVLLRDPRIRFGQFYHRMYSLPRRSGFTQLRLALVRRRGMVARPKSVEDHRHNLALLATYMRRRKAEFIDMQGHAATRLQSHDVRRPLAAGGMPLFADRLDRDLADLAGRADLAAALAPLARAEHLPPDIATALDGPVAEAVQSLYRADCDLYDGLRDAAGLPVGTTSH